MNDQYSNVVDAGQQPSQPSQPMQPVVESMVKSHARTELNQTHVTPAITASASAPVVAPTFTSSERLQRLSWEYQQLQDRAEASKTELEMLREHYARLFERQAGLRSAQDAYRDQVHECELALARVEADRMAKRGILMDFEAFMKSREVFEETARIGAERTLNATRDAREDAEREFTQLETKLKEIQERMPAVANRAVADENKLRTLAPQLRNEIERVEQLVQAEASALRAAKDAEAAAKRAAAERSAAAAAEAAAAEAAAIQEAEKANQAIEAAERARAEAIAQRERLLSQASQYSSSAHIETQRAADSAAIASARTRELQLIDEEVSQLEKQKKSIESLTESESVVGQSALWSTPNASSDMMMSKSEGTWKEGSGMSTGAALGTGAAVGAGVGAGIGAGAGGAMLSTGAHAMSVKEGAVESQQSQWMRHEEQWRDSIAGFRMMESTRSPRPDIKNFLRIGIDRITNFTLPQPPPGVVYVQPSSLQFHINMGEISGIVLSSSSIPVPVAGQGADNVVSVKEYGEIPLNESQLAAGLLHLDIIANYDAQNMQPSTIGKVVIRTDSLKDNHFSQSNFKIAGLDQSILRCNLLWG